MANYIESLFCVTPHPIHQCRFPCPQSAPIVALFYAGYFMATNYIILNLIVASVLEQFVVRDSEKRALQRRQAIRRAANAQVRPSGTG